MDYSRIKAELEQKNMTFRDLCYKIDVTEQGLHQMIRNKSMKIEVLERISSVLELPVSHWFDDESEEVKKEVINRYLSPQIIHQKIDSLTRDLNEMLKEMLPK